MSGDHNMYASGSGDGQRTGWRKRTIQEMAREAEAYIAATEDFVGWSFTNEQLKAFAALVRADERDKWMERTVILIRGEREACAKVCDRMAQRTQDIRSAALESAAENIRARGQK